MEENDKTEIWKSIPGYHGHYECSNMGRVRSISRCVKRESITKDLFVKGRIIKSDITPKGYKRLQLTVDSKSKKFFVHKLVALTFLENPKNYPIINHKDGIKLNNTINNLEWVTHSQNLIHAYDNNLKKSNWKNIVVCNELGVSFEGCVKMENYLRRNGYPRARASAISNCVNGRSKSHLDLTFISIDKLST